MALRHSVSATVVIAILLVSITVVTIIGNILVCLAVGLVRKLRKPNNYLLVSLAVSDLGVGIFVMPLALLHELYDPWPFGIIACNLWVSLDQFFCTASILNLCVNGIDRYLAITKPFEYVLQRTSTRLARYLIAVWLGAACITFPPLLILGNEHEFPDGRPRCDVSQNVWYQIYATLGSFYIPLIVMLIVYYNIFRAAWKITKDDREMKILRKKWNNNENPTRNGPQQKRLSVASDDASSIEDTSNAVARWFRRGKPSLKFSGITSIRKKVPGIRTKQCSGHTGLGSKCFATSSVPRRSNESQCPMLAPQRGRSPAVSPRGAPPPGGPVATGAGGGGSVAGGVGAVHHKKLRFALAKERKASTTLGIIMSAFVICWLPFFVLALVRPFVHGIPDALSSFFLWLGYANSLFNPVIYATTNRDFRKPFQMILYFRCGSLNHMMREEFYHSQYGDPDNQYYVINTNQHVPKSPTCYREDMRTVEDPAGPDAEEEDGDESPPPPAEDRNADESFL